MRNIPEDLRAEVLLDYLQEGSFHILLQGLHKRNACQDLLDVENDSAGRMTLKLARMSLYNFLPEYFFHPTNRFDQLDGREMRDQFLEEYERQNEEKEEAIAFFSPVDIALLALKRDVYREILPFVTENKVLWNILGDNLTKEQLQNRFIKKSLPFLPDAKRIRGCRTFLTLLLRKIFKEEHLEISPIEETRIMEDVSPKYKDDVGGLLGEVFAGNQYDANLVCYCVHYWSDDDCDEHFLQFVDEVEQFRLFARDWFLSVEEDLVFRIEDNSANTWLSDSLTYNYLNYNTNL